MQIKGEAVSVPLCNLLVRRMSRFLRPDAADRNGKHAPRASRTMQPPVYGNGGRCSKVTAHGFPCSGSYGENAAQVLSHRGLETTPDELTPKMMCVELMAQRNVGCTGNKRLIALMTSETASKVPFGTALRSLSSCTCWFRVRGMDYFFWRGGGSNCHLPCYL